MALWSITTPTNTAEEASGETIQCTSYSMQQEPEQLNLAECVPVMEPLFTFSNLLSEPHVLATNGSERVRSLAYNTNSNVSSNILNKKYKWMPGLTIGIGFTTSQSCWSKVALLGCLNFSTSNTYTMYIRRLSCPYHYDRFPKGASLTAKKTCVCKLTALEHNCMQWGHDLTSPLLTPESPPLTLWAL